MGCCNKITPFHLNQNKWGLVGMRKFFSALFMAPYSINTSSIYISINISVFGETKESRNKEKNFIPIALLKYLIASMDLRK